MWSLGVLLYIIMFGENPFYNAEDTMRAELHPPHNDVSPGCMDLIESCLEPDPTKRASLWYIKEHSWVTLEASTEDYNLEDVIPCNQAEIAPVTHYQVNNHKLFMNSGKKNILFRKRAVLVVIQVVDATEILRVRIVWKRFWRPVMNILTCTLLNK